MAIRRYDIEPIEGLDPQIGLLLGMLDETTEKWREYLGEVSEEAIVWQPARDGHSIGGVLLHIADVEAYWLYEIASGQPRTQEELDRLLSESTDQHNYHWPQPPKLPLSWYIDQLKNVRARTHKIVRYLNVPEHIGYRKNQNDEFTLRWLLYHVMVHEAYHGGQAVLLALQFASSQSDALNLKP